MPSPKRLVTLALFAALLPGPAAAGVQDLTRSATGHVGTRVTLAGLGEHVFVVDTAASSSAIYEHARTALGLEPDPALRAELGGAEGSRMIDLYRLPPMTIAGVQAEGLVAAGLPAGVKHGEEVMGLIGVDVLRGRVVEFDLKAYRFGLHAAGHQPASERGWDEIPLRMIPQIGFATVEVSIAGQPVTAVLDTGASRSIVNWHAARACGVTPESAGLEKASNARDATGRGLDSTRFQFDGIAIGATGIGSGDLLISDLSVFAPLGLKDKPAMILGIDLLGDRRFVIDYPGQRLLIER